MNTKSIIGIIIVVIIIALIAVWLVKAPKSPQEPAAPVATDNSGVTAASPATTSQTAASAPAAAPAPASSGKIISTNTIDGMKIEVTKEGTGEPIKNGQTAVMLYTGKLADGSVFDSTANHGNQPFSFSLGAGQVIKGWDEGIVGMKVGEERTLIIPPELGYGANGYPPVIPANATLTFDVTLVGIK
jgi:FKBP-type peptidyl-prolyl cis-trans isomerase